MSSNPSAVGPPDPPVDYSTGAGSEGSREPDDPVEPLLTLSEVRSYLHVPEGDFSLDSQLAAYIDAAAVRIDNELKRYADSTPPLPGTGAWRAARDAARYCFLHMWYRDHFQVELARSQREEYETSLEALRQAIVADKPPRTQSMVISPGRSLTERIYEPAAIDQYLTREFI